MKAILTLDENQIINYLSGLMLLEAQILVTIEDGDIPINMSQEELQNTLSSVLEDKATLEAVLANMTDG